MTLRPMPPNPKTMVRLPISTLAVLITAPILNISDSVNHVSCSGGIDGAVFVSVSGDADPYYVNYAY